MERDVALRVRSNGGALVKPRSTHEYSIRSLALYAAYIRLKVRKEKQLALRLSDGVR